MNIAKQKALTSFFEGRNQWAYKDSKGYSTIGYGRNIDKRSGPGLRECEMIYMLENDLKEIDIRLSVDLDFYFELNPPRRAVLIDMAYNMGVAGLLKFKKTLGCLRNKDYEGAADQMLDSQWKTDVGPRRYMPLVAMMRSGEWVAIV